MAGAHQHAAVAGAQRKDMARRGDVGCRFARVDRNSDGAGAIMGRDAGAHALTRLDRHGEGSLVARRVVGGHERQAQRIDPRPRQREADQPAPVGGHEVHGFGRGHLRGDDQIALILAVLVIDKDEHAPVARILDDILDGTDGVAPVFLDRAGCLERGAVSHGMSFSCCPAR